MPYPECITCGRSEFTAIYEQTLLRCGHCGFITANTDVDEAILRRVYDAAFFDGEEVYDYRGTKDSRQLNFRRRLERVLAVTGQDSIHSVLEIGAAFGFFGEVMLQRLPDISYTGIDVAEAPIRYGREELGLDLEHGDYLARDYETPFTDIYLWDVIEHLAHPEDFLRKIHADLAPGGHLVVGTPDISALLPRLRGRRWRNIHPPSHLQYFSAATLRLFLERHGFTPMATLHPPVWRSARTIFHLAVARRWGNPLTRGIMALIPKGLTIPINTYDNMIVIAKRHESKDM